MREGEWALREACIQVRRWQEQGCVPVRVAVNVSGVQLRRPDFVSLVDEVLEEAAIEGSLLELELTESTLMENVEANVEILNALKARGIGLAMDDFGTGYSSLRMMKHFPIDRLKIDRSFIRNVNHDTQNAAIVEAVLAIGRTLGLEVVAEGVETEDELRFLVHRECDEVQGFYFSRPLPALEIARLLMDNEDAAPGAATALARGGNRDDSFRVDCRG